jgi:V/A-type H+-transporting ATPase subunit I
MLGVLGAGVVAIALFMTPPSKLKTQWFDHFMLPLTVINNFVDIVSYLRLFAVGAATLAVASAFNGMAAGAAGGFMGRIVGGLAAALILLFGHTLNMAMAVLGVMVHGLRLNTLEFSQHVGITWKGFPYSPFRRQAEGEAETVEQRRAGIHQATPNTTR